MTKLFEQPYVHNKEEGLDSSSKAEQVPPSEPVIHSDKQEGFETELKDAAMEARDELLKDHQALILQNWEDIKKHDTRLIRFFQVTAALEAIASAGIAFTGFSIEPSALMLMLSSGSLFEADTISHVLRQKLEKVKSKLRQIEEVRSSS